MTMSPFTGDTAISVGEEGAYPHGRMLLCTVYTGIQETFWGDQSVLGIGWGP